MKMKYTLTLGILTAQLITQPLFAETKTSRPTGDDNITISDPRAVDDSQEKVQIAVLLDTSGSMSGLIDQTRTQLWKVVNTFIEAHRDGKAPYVEVALYEYGNSSLHMGNNYIRQIQPFTRDLDQLSSDLFALRTNGGEEYCGAVIQRALGDLKWDASAKTYKTIFIAGNEPFTQGSVDARAACRDAAEKGIIVNTIHCGNRDAGIAGHWHDGAALAEGKYMIIDQDKAVAHITAPQDKAIRDLGLELNETYIGYGLKHKEAKIRQEVADVKATENARSGAAVGRSVTKASANYSNASWDIVDAHRMKKVNLNELPKDQLPEEMRGMNEQQKKDYIEKAARKRAIIQAQILDLNKQREAFVKKERQKLADSGDKTLDQVLIEAARTQAKALGYSFESKAN